MILYCDVDSTVNDHWRRIQRHTVNGVAQESAFTYVESMRDAPLPHARETLRRFHAAGWEINFLTSRRWDADGEATRDWLNEQGIPFASVNIVHCHEEKVAFLKARPYDLYIDDFTVWQERAPAVEFLTEIHAAIPRSEVCKTFEPDWWLQLDAKYL